jgi:hypothetical protein
MGTGSIASLPNLQYEETWRAASFQMSTGDEYSLHMLTSINFIVYF